MIIINTIDDRTFSFNEINYFKNFIGRVYGDRIDIQNVYDSRIQLTEQPRHFDEFEIDGVIYPNVLDAVNALQSVLFSFGENGSSGANSAIIQIPDLTGIGEINQFHQTPDGDLYTWNGSEYVAVVDQNNFHRVITIDALNDLGLPIDQVTNQMIVDYVNGLGIEILDTEIYSIELIEGIPYNFILSSSDWANADIPITDENSFINWVQSSNLFGSNTTVSNFSIVNNGEIKAVLDNTNNTGNLVLSEMNLTGIIKLPVTDTTSFEAEANPDLSGYLNLSEFLNPNTLVEVFLSGSAIQGLNISGFTAITGIKIGGNNFTTFEMDNILNEILNMNITGAIISTTGQQTGEQPTASLVTQVINLGNTVNL